MVLPYQGRLVLPVSVGVGGSVLRPLLTSVHEPGLPSPRLSGKPYSRVRSQISPNKNVNLSLHKLAIYPESVGIGFAIPAGSPRSLSRPHMTFLYVASQLWRECGQPE